MFKFLRPKDPMLKIFIDGIRKDPAISFEDKQTEVNGTKRRVQIVQLKGKVTLIRVFFPHTEVVTVRNRDNTSVYLEDDAPYTKLIEKEINKRIDIEVKNNQLKSLHDVYYTR